MYSKKQKSLMIARKYQLFHKINQGDIDDYGIKCQSQLKNYSESIQISTENSPLNKQKNSKYSSRESIQKLIEDSDKILQDFDV